MDGRYSYPYLPEGIYADLREAVSSRERIVEELNAVTNRLKRWLKIYFPEYFTVYKAIIAAGCKLIRVFYTILKHGVDYDPQKLRMDIIRPESAAA